MERVFKVGRLLIFMELEDKMIKTGTLPRVTYMKRPMTLLAKMGKQTQNPHETQKLQVGKAILSIREMLGTLLCLHSE